MRVRIGRGVTVAPRVGDAAGSQNSEFGFAVTLSPDSIIALQFQ